MADAVATAGVKRRAEEQPGAKVAKPPPASTMVVLPHLKAYYKSLFPCELFYRWLSYGSASYFLKREFTLTLLGDVYIRYNCYTSAAEFRKALCTKVPEKIDIGPVYTAPPSQHAQVKKDAFKAAERELIFDIDLTDYDDVRTCCSGGGICGKCWAYMAVAVRLLDMSLRTDFGFQSILFVYSGRRGVHCWVCDEGARALTNDARSAIVDYMSAMSGDGGAGAGGHGGSGGGVSLSKISAGITVPLHPAMSRAFAELEAVFEQRIIPDSGQGLLSHETQWRKLVEQLPEIELDGPGSSLRGLVEVAWANKSATPEQRWRQLKQTVKSAVDSARERSLRGGSGSRMKPADRVTLEKLIPAIVFTYCYPRLDVNVSKQRNHLLKAPFCIHPKTGRVCVPLDPEAVEAFDPEAVPTLEQLIIAAGINSRLPAAAAGADEDGEENGGASASVTDLWKLTPLRPHIEAFDAFVRGCEKETRRGLRAEQEAGAAFTGAW